MAEKKTPTITIVETSGPPPELGLTNEQLRTVARAWYGAEDADPMKRPPTLEELRELARVFGD